MVIVVLIVAITLCTIGSLILIAINGNTLSFSFLGLVFLWVGLFILVDMAYIKGLEEGAYNQLRGKYEINYVMNKDSCITDTIINIK